jgi:hypothetical protein
MNMLIDILNRLTAKAVKRKDDKTSLRSSFVAFIALRYLFLFIKKTSNASEARRSDITCFGVGVADTYINQLNEKTK